LNYLIFLEEVMIHGGVEEREQADRIARAVVESLGELLLDHDRRAIGSTLPAPLAGALVRGEPGWSLGTSELYHRVAQRLSVRDGLGLEHTHVVCRALARTLDEDSLVFLRSRLPEQFAELLRDQGGGTPPHFVHRLAHDNAANPGHTLSTGSPGSTHPVSEAKGRAQSGSIASAANPHADRKLSSAKGGPEHGHGDTLARGKPGSRRPLSEYDEY
jgi:uncharacterized protein (DUF2267 family)